MTAKSPKPRPFVPSIRILPILSALPIVGMCATLAFTSAGCGGNGTTADGGADLAAAPDMAVTPPDMAVTPPDMVVIPPDMTVQKYSSILLLQDVSVTYPVATDGGVQNVSGRVLIPVVTSGPAGGPNTHDFDDRNAFGLGCFADHYAANGKMPGKDTNAGTVVITGYASGLKTLDGNTAPDEIDCVVVNGSYKCGYGMAMNGMPGPDPATALFPSASTPIPTGRAIRFKYAGGMLGTYDSMNAAVATETLLVTDDLTKIKYDPTMDATINFTCPEGMGGKCPTGAILVQLVASSKNIGEMGYPGTDYGVSNCVALASANKIVIGKDVLAKMYGGSMTIKQVYTRVVRGSLPPSGQMDSQGNAVTLAVGRGVTGFAPR